MIEVDKIYNEDCLEGMKRIPDSSIDAVICDLPYGVLNRNNPDAKWDNIIPFAPLWEQYKRVTKHDSPIILFAQGMFTAQLLMSNPKMWKYNLVWHKSQVTGFLNANRMPLRKHEDICVFYRQLPTYHPQMTPCDPSQRNHRGGHSGKNRCYGNFTRTESRTGDDKFPTSVIQVARDLRGGVLHPTQKPVALVEYLIRTYTDEGDIVLDNCMGSGTTAVAAINTGRHFVGFETNKEYFDIANKRIEQTLKNKQND